MLKDKLTREKGPVIVKRERVTAPPLIEDAGIFKSVASSTQANPPHISEERELSRGTDQSISVAKTGDHPRIALPDTQLIDYLKKENERISMNLDQLKEENIEMKLRSRLGDESKQPNIERPVNSNRSRSTSKSVSSISQSLPQVKKLSQKMDSMLLSMYEERQERLDLSRSISKLTKAKSPIKYSAGVAAKKNFFKVPKERKRVATVVTALSKAFKGFEEKMNGIKQTVNIEFN